jgi:lambda repressor-like predicted transcriptional regulator
MPISQQDKHLRHQRVRYELGKRQLSFARLASEAGLDRSVLAAVSASRKTSRRAAQIIADALHTTPEALWPDIYGDVDD